MNSFSSNRRELLRMSALGLGAVVGSSLPEAYALPRSPTPSGGMPGIFDVRTYGAAGDGKTVDTAAINKAIDAAAAAGGGTVIFPPGTWLSFSIHLKSHVGLYLSQGATILAADSPLPEQTTGYNGGTYDAAEPNTPWEDYQDYGHNHWHNSLIWGENLRHQHHRSGDDLRQGSELRSPAQRARQLSNLRGRAGGRRQQEHRAQELP